MTLDTNDTCNTLLHGIAWYCMVLCGITWYLVFWGIWFISLMNRATAHKSFFHFIHLDLIYSVLCFYCPNVLFQCSLCVFYVICKSIHEVFNVMYSRAARIVAALQPGCEEMEREWGNEEEMEIEWGNKEEMERKWGNGERFTLYISSFSPYFLPLYPFPISKFVTFCPKMLNTAFLSRMSQKT